LVHKETIKQPEGSQEPDQNRDRHRQPQRGVLTYTRGRVRTLPSDAEVLPGADDVVEAPLVVKTLGSFLTGLRGFQDLCVTFGPGRPGIFSDPLPNKHGDMVMGPCLVVEDEVVPGDPNDPESYPSKEEPKDVRSTCLKQAGAFSAKSLTSVRDGPLLRIGAAC
jgi:hypothetical protein